MSGDDGGSFRTTVVKNEIPARYRPAGLSGIF